MYRDKQNKTKQKLTICIKSRRDRRSRGHYLQPPKTRNRSLKRKGKKNKDDSSYHNYTNYGDYKYQQSPRSPSQGIVLHSCFFTFVVLIFCFPIFFKKIKNQANKITKL